MDQLASTAPAHAYAQYVIALGDFLGTVGRLEEEVPTFSERAALQQSLKSLPAEGVKSIFEQLNRLTPRLRQAASAEPQQKRDIGEALTLLGMALRRIAESSGSRQPVAG